MVSAFVECFLIDAFSVIDAICVCGRNFSFYVNRKCQLSTAEMSLYRVVDMLGNSC